MLCTGILEVDIALPQIFLFSLDAIFTLSKSVDGPDLSLLSVHQGRVLMLLVGRYRAIWLCLYMRRAPVPLLVTSELAYGARTAKQSGSAEMPAEPFGEG